MKVFALTIVILALNGYVTRATSLDPLENVEIDESKTDRDDSRTKRSGNIFSSLLKKKFGLLSSITGTSSGKSIGHFDNYPEHFEEPLSYHTKSFNLWGVKKAIMSSVFQAAKAITGGVIALKGQLIKAKGHAVVAKGKLMQTKGEAISNFGKTIATHAFDVHHEPQLDVHSSVGLFNHLPVTPIHHPTSYGAATAFGYQGQGYPSNVYQGNAYQSNAYPSNSYQVAPPSYQTGFGVPQTGYDSGAGYGGYGGNGFTAKRAVVQNAQESTVKQVQSAFDKDSVHAGLLIFKPIKMPVQNVPAAGNLVTSQSTASSQQAIGQRPSQQLGAGAFNPSSFKTPQQGFGFQKPFPNRFQSDVLSEEYSPDLSPGYQAPDIGYQAPNLGYQAQNPGFQAQNLGFQAQNPGFQAQNPGFQAQNPGFQASNLGYQAPNLGQQAPNLGYPSNGGSAEQTAGHGFGGGLQNFDFQQPANSQELGQQLAAISGQQLQQTSFSQESLNDDQRDLGSGVDERMAQPSYKRVSQAVNTKRGGSGSIGQSTPSVTADFSNGDEAKTKKRSAPLPPSHVDEIVPLKYHDDSTAEDQARLKQTVQRFFSMLQKQR
ncbi:glutenin, high molecular weight subunit PW212 [Myzus persicae]|uniref:glutenin, high molecular weight subunit PW212 n=1 Tax=Myzus persicae TaxID=13164 RepID=UPI000B937EEE|nr:glutenin, high molecular weight subunit PW212 [Myzus persicae]